MRRPALLLLLAALLAPGAAAARPAEALPPPPAALARVRLELVVAGLDQPVGVHAWPGDPRHRLLVVERRGRVRVVEGGKLLPSPLVDLSARVRTRHDEQGLLGLALHPQFAADRRLYVDYTDLKGDTRVVELRLGDGDRIAAERELLFVRQPYANHNGGQIVFGPDGKLYIGMGDGGAGYDPHGNGQSRDTLLGKLLRIDVEAAGRPPVATVLLGLRNPWRFSFDRALGDLYIADVGQDRWEEIDVLPAALARGDSRPNLGWSVREGAHCLREPCAREGFVEPVAEYSHAVGCSVTGGFVYRGRALPELEGLYFYADYCTALVRSLRWKDGRVTDAYDWRGVIDPDSKLAKLSTFGEDEVGELYLVSLEGAIYRLARR